MSSIAPSKLSPFRSLFVGVSIAMVVTLTLSFYIFRAITFRLERRRIDTVYDRLDELQSDAAIRIRDSKGDKNLKEYLEHLDQVSGLAHHYLLDANGNDLLTGENRSALLPPAPARHWRIRTGGKTITAQHSPDGRYWFAVVGAPPTPWLSTYLPYYFLVAGATALLCWLFSALVISPVRSIAASITRFGAGDLSARVHLARTDEIGQLAGSFNQMAEQLERKIQNEKRLLADVSHELRSPLARLKFAVKLARTSKEHEAALDRIDRDVDRITSLVAGIVESASAEQDFDARQLEKVQLGDLLNEVVRDCTLEADIRHCKISLHAKLEFTVLGTRELLRRAIENVLRNAIRYSPEHGVIEIAASVEKDRATVTIRDHGPGVHEDLLPRIFDPFFRGEQAADASEIAGSGLGLSIAKRALLLHGGEIHASNASPGLSVQLVVPWSAQSAQRSWNF